MEVSRTWMKFARPFLVGLFIGALAVYFGSGALADNDIVRPNDTGTSVAGTAVGCTSGLRYECLNDVVTQPTNPDTGTDYLQLVNNETNHSLLGTIVDVDAVTDLTVWIYHREGGSNARTSVGLYAANESTAHGGPTTLALQTGANWDSVTYSGLSLNQTQLDALRLRISCGKVGGGSSNDCFAYAAYVDVTYDPQIEVTVGSAGSQQNLEIGTTSAYIGGTFTITENVSSRNVTSITIEENGSVNAQTNLDNIELWYDLDTTGGDGYNCSDQSFNGDEIQFGSTDTDGFSGTNGVSTFTGSVSITTTQTMCVYTVLDVASSASPGETILIEIDDPSSDVVASGTNVDVVPSTSVLLSGPTILQAQNRTQIHYHWRNDDGDETDSGLFGASSATGGSEDTTLDALGIGNNIRLRMEVSNEGNQTSDTTQYRLEYARKISTCGAATGWTDVGAGGGDFDMFNTGNLTDGNNTTNIAVSSGGVSNENTTFLTPNGGVRDTNSQTGSITLTSSEYVEMEFSIVATANATAGFTYCFRLTDSGTEIDTYLAYPEATILADITVSSVGSQLATVNFPDTDVESGANIRIVDNIFGNTTVQSITITASGTVDYQNDIDDIELWYDLDIITPFDCASVSFDGNETQFGATDTNGFSAAGVSTFTDSQVISTLQTMCVYVVYNVSSNVTNDETLDLKIDDASTDVVIDSGTVAPASLVDLNGVTTFVTDIATQVHYHWRADNGSEGTADSLTDANEDTLLENLRRTVPVRLRVGVANEGSSATPAYQYRLEYALKVSTCSAASGWTDVGATDDAFNLFNSANITDGGNTTNIDEADGGVTDVGDTYLISNGGLKDTSSQTGSITLPGKNFVDLEYALVASSTATEGATYCFRVTNAGSTIDGYDVYPQVTIKPRTDFFVQRNVATISGTSATLTAGVDYVAPSAASTAFIRIVGTNNSGAGSSAGTGNADDVTVHVSNPGNITSSVTFTRPATAAGTTRVAWEIIEYVGAPGGDNEIVVRDQSTATYGSANTTVTTGAVSNVTDDADVAVFITGQGNPNTTTNYSFGLSTAAWNSGADTVTFTRGASSNAAVVSYAVVEFVGDNWNVQRTEHTYTAAGSAETESITAVGSLSRTFLHDQKRIGSGLNNHSDYGHVVYLSGMGQVSFALDSGASTPSSHTSVAWIVENTQDIGDTMIVTRSNGSESAGSAPKTINANIGATISDTQDASLFVNNYGNEAGGGSSQNSFPEPIYGGRIISETQYELWVADPDNDTRTWRAEVVEWPTAARDIEQNYYQFYANNDDLTPTDPWPPGATNIGNITEITELDGPIALNEAMRLRMTLLISSAAMDSGLDAFKLQYGERTSTCTAISESQWHDVGDIGSTTALWRGTTTSQTDGAAISTDPPTGGDLLITAVSDVAGTLEEENPSAFTPYDVDPGEDVEFDWVVEHNGAAEKTSYCFRMIEADGQLFDDYLHYPTMRTAGYTPTLSRWRFYDDETSITPSSALAAENVSPSSVENNNIVKLRTTVKESTGGAGTDIKFKLQYSEYSDFSNQVFDVATSSLCTATSTWCYADGAGTDNGIVDSAVLSDADSCTGGSGGGCGTHNESVSTSTAIFDHPPYASTEYEFTLRHAGARVGTVYYFRLYDVVNDAVLPASTTNPSLTTESASLVFTVGGLPVGTSTEGVTTDVTTTPTTIPFGEVPIDTEYNAAHRLTVDTNATAGYQVFLFARQNLLSGEGDEIQNITGTNAAPVAWSSGCLTSNTGCVGYHSGDESLADGSARFSAIDTYAALSTSTEEIMYSSIPVSEYRDIVYRLQINSQQLPGNYETNIVYLIVPVF